MEKTWSGKWILLAVLLGVAGWAAWGMMRRGTDQGVIARSSINTKQTYRCVACGAEFKMDWAERRKLGRSGKVVMEEGALPRLPCPMCGKTEAKLKVEGRPSEYSTAP